MSTVSQMGLFGAASPINQMKQPHELPKPKNDWALSVYIVLNHPKGVTVFDAQKMYGMVKFQERLNEVLKEHPLLVSKKMIKVPKRLGRIVEVMRYKIEQSEAATKLYTEVLNHKGASKTLNLKNKDITLGRS
jgi:hypothetical protein